MVGNMGRAPTKKKETRTFGAPIENIASIMETARPSLSPASRRIVDYMLKNRADVLRMSITELAEKSDASEAAVTKVCKQLGMTGFQQLKMSLARDVVQPVQYIQEDLARDDDIETVMQKVFHADMQALRDTLQVLKPEKLAAARDIIRKAKRVELYGIGSAAPIAEDAQYRLRRIGINAVVEVDSHKQAISASLTDKDVAVLTVSHSGATIETLTAMRLAHEAGAKTICITNFGKSPIQRYSHVVLETVARETKFRTEAMASRIAQLAIVDALIASLALADYERAVSTIRHTFDVLSVKRS